MNDMMNTLFGPLDVKYCNYFYFISILGFIFLSISLFMFVMSLIKSGRFERNSFMFAVQGFLVYFVNRLLHSMCTK
jgi:hypothetical protein